MAENNMVQSGVVDGFKPTMESRMVRSERYKYCLYQYGTRPESLYDLQTDPLETVNLAGAPNYRAVLRQHRRFLREFGKTHNDPLVGQLLANNVGPKECRRHSAPNNPD